MGSQCSPKLVDVGLEPKERIDATGSWNRHKRSVKRFLQSEIPKFHFLDDEPNPSYKVHFLGNSQTVPRVGLKANWSACLISNWNLMDKVGHGMNLRTHQSPVKIFHD
jgi:hypothetical protein